MTSHWTDEEAFESAHALLSSDDDPRREKVFALIHRVAAGEVTWDDFARITKKGLIRRAQTKPPPPSADAIALSHAPRVLLTMLAEAGVDDERPDARAVWRSFVAFASLPVSATPLLVENDMCLFQWGLPAQGEGVNFECPGGPLP